MFYQGRGEDVPGRSPGLAVMGGYSCLRGHEFESQHRILPESLLPIYLLQKLYIEINWKEDVDDPLEIVFQRPWWWSRSYFSETNISSQSEGSPGLVVMGGDSCSKGHEFESRHRILDGHFFTYLLL